MKKTQTVSFHFLALVALIIPSTFGVVLDTDGNQVVAGTEYYILPAVSGNGGGLRVAEAMSCPPNPYIIKVSDESDNGLPVVFSPVNSTQGTAVSLSADSNIKFSASTICVQSTVWTLNREWFVTTGGEEGNPGRQTISNWFNVLQFDDAYKLVYCPTVCDLCRPFCGELSLENETEDGLTRLVVSRDPFKVMFKKVN